jgi:hypothetical protein
MSVKSDENIIECNLVVLLNSLNQMVVKKNIIKWYINIARCIWIRNI